MEFDSKSFSLDHLTYIEFENLCCDLLISQGYKNISWRKGKGRNSSSADHGRDIEGEMFREYVGGKCIRETWFFECKHHKAGISPSNLDAALAWAQAKCPDFLILIASNFFSTPTKEYLED